MADAGLDIAVACLNNAWAAGPYAWLGRRQFDQARQACAGADLRVALMHHPFAALHPSERERAAKALPLAFDLVLHGPESGPDHDSHARVVAGRAFSDPAAPGHYQIIRVDTERRACHGESRAGSVRPYAGQRGRSTLRPGLL